MAEKTPAVGRIVLLCALALPFLAPAVLAYAVGHYRWLLLFVIEDAPTQWAAAGLFAWCAALAWDTFKVERDAGRRSRPILLVCVLSAFFALEEISWAQRLFGWNLPQIVPGQVMEKVVLYAWFAIGYVYLISALLRLPFKPVQELAGRIRDREYPLPGPATLIVGGAGLTFMMILSVAGLGQFLCALALWSFIEEFRETRNYPPRENRQELSLTLFLLGAAQVALHLSVLDRDLSAVWTGPLRVSGFACYLLAAAIAREFFKEGRSLRQPVRLPGLFTSALLVAAAGFWRLTDAPGWHWWTLSLVLGAVWVHLRGPKIALQFSKPRLLACAAAAPVLAWCLLAMFALELGVRVPPRADLRPNEQCTRPTPLCLPELREFARRRPAYISNDEKLMAFFECERPEGYCGFRADDGSYIEGTLLARSETSSGTVHHIGASQPFHYRGNRTAATLFWLYASGKNLMGPALLTLAVWWLLILATRRDHEGR